MSRKRYSIMVVQYGTNHEVELCRVERDPDALAQAVAEKDAAGEGRRAHGFHPKIRQGAGGRP